MPPILYYPHANFVLLWEDFPAWVILFLYIGTLILAVLIACFKHKRFVASQMRPSLRIAVLCVLSVQILIQLYSQQGYLLSTQRTFQEKTLDGQYIQLFGGTYLFSRFVLDRVPGACTGKLLTDHDPSQTVIPFIVKYFLYPRINLLDDNDSGLCLVLFEKSDPYRFIPKDYRVVGVYNLTSMVAIRPNL